MPTTKADAPGLPCIPCMGKDCPNTVCPVQKKHFSVIPVKSFCEQHIDQMTKVEGMSHDITNIQDDLRNHKEWRNRVENKLDTINTTVDSKVTALDARLETRFQEIQASINSLRGKIWMMWGGVLVLAWVGTYLLDTLMKR